MLVLCCPISSDLIHHAPYQVAATQQIPTQLSVPFHSKSFPMSQNHKEVIVPFPLVFDLSVPLFRLVEAYTQRYNPKYSPPVRF